MKNRTAFLFSFQKLSLNFKKYSFSFWRFYKIPLLFLAIFFFVNILNVYLISV